MYGDDGKEDTGVSSPTGTLIDWSRTDGVEYEDDDAFARGSGGRGRWVEVEDGAFLTVFVERSIGDEKEEKLKRREVLGEELEECSGDDACGEEEVDVGRGGMAGAPGETVDRSD
ncbi:MAG: hypothetical protein BYD32DRAFT_440185 [Podila humilis]|nr:MAG: hypothetical protein BYD32DRAFT_440185 [Podila humilis]